MCVYLDQSLFFGTCEKFRVNGELFFFDGAHLPANGPIHVGPFNVTYFPPKNDGHTPIIVVCAVALQESRGCLAVHNPESKELFCVDGKKWKRK